MLKRQIHGVKGSFLADWHPSVQRLNVLAAPIFTRDNTMTNKQHESLFQMKRMASSLYSSLDAVKPSKILLSYQSKAGENLGVSKPNYLLYTRFGSAPSALKYAFFEKLFAINFLTRKETF